MGVARGCRATVVGKWEEKASGIFRREEDLIVRVYGFGIENLFGIPD